MVVTVDKLKIAYFPVPKAANTSMKHLLHTINTGERFSTTKNEATGALRHIHAQYKTPKFSLIKPEEYLSFFRIAIVRDPVERVVSAWRNRVVHHKELESSNSAERIDIIGLPIKPTLSEFVMNLEEYRKANKSIATHTDPLTDFLGKSQTYYNLIFDISEYRQIEIFFSTLTGEQKKLPRKQTGGPPADRNELPNDLVRKLERTYEDDYQVFGSAFGKQSDTDAIVKLARRHKASIGGFFKRLMWGQRI